MTKQIFENLQKICMEKLEIANSLYNKKVSLLVKQEIESLKENGYEIINENNKYYTNNYKISLVISNEGNLEIIDERGTAFFWLFEVKFLEQFRLSDNFFYNGNAYSVKNLNFNEWDKGIEQIEKIVCELDKTINKLNYTSDLKSLSHSYFDCTLDIECKSIFDVIKTVLDREPYCL